MAYLYEEPSRTFSEYLLIPGYSSTECIPANVSLKTPLVKYKKGEEPSITLNIPMSSAIMQSVSGEEMAKALSREGGISFIYGSQPIDAQCAMVARVKAFKAGFVPSDSNLRAEDTLSDLIALKEKKGHSTIAVTEDGSSSGTLLGVVSSRDWRPSRTSLDTPINQIMTPFANLVYAREGITLSEANDIIWEHKLNSLPIVDEKKRYRVGAGINTRDYKERVPALVHSGADVLCIDSSEGYSEWQRLTLSWIKKQYGDRVKVGAGNVVDREGFLFLAESGADFVKVGIGGGSICITRETKGIGRGQATALLEVAKARDEYFNEKGV